MDETKLKEIVASSNFVIHDNTYVYAKVSSSPSIDDCFLITKDKDEVTVVVTTENLDKVELIERNKDDYKLIELKVSLPFYAVGFLAAVTKAISAKGCNNLIVSTYSKDYVFVRVEQLELARKALLEAGFREG